MLGRDVLIRNTDNVVYQLKQSVQPHTTATLNDFVIGTSLGNCTVNVQLDEVRGALPDGEITDDPAVYEDVRATSLSADTITLSGVNDTPTTITLEGIEYNVLAATANI